MNDFDKQLQVLHSAFDFDTHNKTFINYCEVAILEDGTIEYAVPSHEQKLLQVTAKKVCMSQQDLMQKLLAKPDWYFEICSFNSKCMLVSNKECRFFFEPSKAQLKSLQDLVGHECVDVCVFDSYYHNLADFNKRHSNHAIRRIVENFF